jgi:hypothetical protein
LELPFRSPPLLCVFEHCVHVAVAFVGVLMASALLTPAEQTDFRLHFRLALSTVRSRTSVVDSSADLLLLRLWSVQLVCMWLSMFYLCKCVHDSGAIQFVIDMHVSIFTRLFESGLLFTTQCPHHPACFQLKSGAQIAHDIASTLERAVLLGGTA